MLQIMNVVAVDEVADEVELHVVTDQGPTWDWKTVNRPEEYTVPQCTRSVPVFLRSVYFFPVNCA